MVPQTLERRLVLLQSITLAWMVIECALALLSAARAHSPALLAFGLDSVVELLSAALVLVAAGGHLKLDRRQTDRIAGALLFALAAVVALSAALALAGKLHPEASSLGMAITAAALIAMPLLGWEKRKLARSTGNIALAADAVQSATCAYLALVSLMGVALNSVFRLGCADATAALAAVPILIVEGRRAMRGQSCGCCGKLTP